MAESMFYRLISEHRDNKRLQSAVILVRVMVGTVFVSEGMQKFLYPETLGVGRFLKIGIPAPDLLAPFVGCVEILCGALLLFGLFTRLAALPLIINMLVAIVTTKFPWLMEKGFWSMAHEARTDWCMLLGLIFLSRAGSGRFSVDASLLRARPVAEYETPPPEEVPEHPHL